MIDSTFDGVTAAFRDSSVYRTARVLRGQFSAASRESAILARARRLTVEIAPRGPEQIVVSAALVLAWAALAHLAMRSLLPRYTTSGLPWWWNVAFALFAFAAAALAGPIAAAWRDSTAAKWTMRRF